MDARKAEKFIKLKFWHGNKANVKLTEKWVTEYEKFRQKLV